METRTQSQETPRTRIWAGRILSTLAILFLIIDGVIKLFKPEFVVKANMQLGNPESAVVPLGIILLVCVAIHMIPRTAVFGAVLLTGYLGGAVASQLRIGEPLFSNVLFPVYVAVLIWGGLYLRNEQVSSLIFPRATRNSTHADRQVWAEAAQPNA